MEIIYARYLNSPKLYLLLYVGENGGNVISFELSSIPNSEIEALKTVFAKLQSESLSKKLEWIKQNMPYTSKHAYRTFKRDKLVIKSRHKPFSK